MNQKLNDVLGALPISATETAFRVWAPRAKSISIVIGGNRHPLEPMEAGYFGRVIEGVSEGDLYRVQVNGGASFPDPASRYQPEGVHGPSQVVSSAYNLWTDQEWCGVAHDALVVYEIHVGTFTDGGTFLSAIERLDELVDLGVTALEIMPLAQTPGRWNWGYDGVNFFAPSNNYGHPDDFKKLVDACHSRGLAVILDVVYNHIGPEGNYLSNFGPYISKQHNTPWGDAFNFDEADSSEVRHFIRENVRYWFEEFHLDGLRIDAIRSMLDDSEIPIINEIAKDTEKRQVQLGRPLHLIGESCVYDSGLLNNGYGAVWSDEVPHVLLSVIANQDVVANRQYRGFERLKHCLDRGYLYEWKQGDIVETTETARGEIGNVIQGLQTHDQVGNHPTGHRLSAIASPEAQKAAAALVLLHPAIPFVFMGEEFSSPSPFCFFVDFGDEWLKKGVIEGRKRDYGHHNWELSDSPLDEATFVKSKLPDRSAGDESTLNWYRSLLQIRKEWQGRGILTPENLKVSVNADLQMVILSYPGVSVVARLAGPNDSTSFQTVDLQGSVQLHSRSLDGSVATLQVNEAAVVQKD